MPRSSKLTESLDVLWADAILTRVTASYERVELEIHETTGRSPRVVASGHIGYRLSGFWDEVVIESADLVRAHPFADLCLDSIAARYGDPWPPTGSPERNSRDFQTLVVSFSDGAVLLCVATRFHIEAL